MSEDFAYDVLEYPAHIHQQMLPALLAPIARVHGIQAASPRNCRLLEVGCGDGLQLITLAMAYPQSHFVGVDLSTAAIARGEALRAQLGLDNLRLVVADLMEWDAGESPFDYILAHGFFSWVPESVRLRLLEVCKKSLASQGVAYISYNAFPGSHLRQMVWEMMRAHVHGINDPTTRIAEARRFIAWLAQDVIGEGSYAVAVRKEAAELLQRTHPSVLFHDDLSDLNQPYSLTGFMELAGGHGLQFLAEADYCEMSDAVVPADAVARLDAFSTGDPLAKEQYLDFLKGRRFRQTLLCHADAGLHRHVDVDALPSLAITGDLDPQPVTLATAPADTVRFANPAGAAITTNHAFVKAALTRIGDAFPKPIAIQQLLDASSGNADDHAALLETLSRGLRYGLIALLCEPPTYAHQARSMPVASPLARLQLEAAATQITSLRPAMVHIDSQVTRELLRLLDGTRDQHALAQALSTRMAELPPPEGEPVQDAAWWLEKLAPQLEQGLQQIANMALLVEE